MYASPWSSPSTSQHSLPGGRYPLPGPDFHRLELASFPGAPKIGSWLPHVYFLQRAGETVLNEIVGAHDIMRQSARKTLEAWEQR